MDISNSADSQLVQKDAGTSNDIGLDELAESAAISSVLALAKSENCVKNVVLENESVENMNTDVNEAVKVDIEVENKTKNPEKVKQNESEVVDDTDESLAYFIMPDDISKTPEEGPTQPRLDAYPKTLMGGSGTPRLRSFCSNWFGRFPWLEYSISHDKVYCFACRHYGSTIFKPNPSDSPGRKFMRKKGATIYATTGFCRWAKAHERMQRHNSSARHLEAMGPWLEDTLNREKRGESSNGTDLLSLNQSENVETIKPSMISTPSPLPSKRKRSRPTKKSAKYGEGDFDTSLGCPTWCTCTKCIEMSKMHECVCCCDVPEIRAKVEALDSTLLCITDHPGFAAICLNEWSIQVAFYHHKQESGPPSVSEEYERFRYIAYCQFVRWCWGFLREDMHIPLPSCVVNNIKARFHSKANLPSLDGLPDTSG